MGGSIDKPDLNVEDFDEEPRDVDTFIADQQKFLANKQFKEEAIKLQKEQQLEQEKNKIPKVNKKSLQLLQ